jgi:TP901 family phage tail tape measure protein
MASPAAVLSILITANSNPAVRGIGRVQTSLGAAEGQAHKTGRTVSNAFKLMAIGAAGAGAASVKMAVEFDRNMRNVNSIAQLPEKSFRRLSKQVRELGGKTAQSPRDLAKGLYDLVSSGFDARESMKILEKSARAASAGLTDTKTSTKAVAAVLNAYHLPARKAGKVSDELFRTVDRGVISFEELAQNIGDTLPFAASLGVRLHEVGAATATMTKQGLGSSETMTRIRNLLQTMIKPGKELEKAFKELGVSGGEQLIRKMGGLQGALDAIVSTTDGSKRAMAGLFPNIRALGGALSLTGKNSQTAARDLKGMEQASGATSRALSEQSKSVAFQWDRLKAQAEGLAIGFGNKLLPELSKVLKMLSDPKLTGEQKFDRLMKMLGDMVNRAIPVIADKAAQLAPKVAEAFVTGFLAAGVWGRLAITGFLLAKMGGIPAFMKVGSTAGVAVGTAMGTSAAAAMQVTWTRAAGGAMLASVGKTGVAAGAVMGKSMGAAMPAAVASSGLKGKLAGLMRSWGPALGLGLAVTLGPELVKQVKQATSGEFQAKLKFEDASKGAKSFDELTASVSKATTELEHGDKAASQMAARFGRVPERVEDTADAFDKLAAPVNRANRIIDRMAEGSSTSIAQLRTNVRIGTRGIKQSLDQDTLAGKEALQKHFQAAIQNIRTSMKLAPELTKAGMQEIERLMRKALAMYGITGSKADNYIKSPVGDTQGKSHGPGSKSGFQRGGPINLGAPSGDSVPAMLERGEYVLNRSAVKKVGRKALDNLNFAAAPRFQGGGIVALGHQLQRQGYAVGEHPAFGGVAPVHAKNSYHYKGMAIDVNADSFPGGEPAALDRLYSRLKNMPGVVELLWRVAGHFDHLHVAMSGAGGPLGMLGAKAPKLARQLVGGPDSALKGIVQGALDTTLAGAQAKLNSAAASVGGVEGPEAGFSGKWTEVMASIAKARGWSLGAWNRLVQKESGGNPAARNPSSGAFGLGQFLGSTAKAYAKYGALSTNPVEQIKAMAQYISDRYGDPSSALAFHDAHNWYAAGGPVGMQGGGFPGMSPINRLVGAGPNLTASFGGGGGGTGLKATLKKIRTGDRGVRRGAVRDLLDKIKDVGLPNELQATLKTLGENSTIFGEYADRAGQLNVTDDDGNIVTLGTVKDKTQVEWIRDQLDALFKWRNAIIDAEKIVVRKREEIAAFITRARERLETVREAIRTAIERRRELAEQLEQLKNHPERVVKTLETRLRRAKLHPKHNKELIKDLEKQLAHARAYPDRDGERIRSLREIIEGIDDNQKGRTRVRDALKDKILPALTGKRETLNTARGDLLSNLETVQGAGSPMNRMTSLPGLGVLGGDIFAVQMRLGELTTVKPKITDTGTGAESERAGLLEQLLREANLRTAVSERQFQVFKDMPQFAGGGVVPGVSGAAVPAVVHAGEGVFTQDQMAAMGGSQIAVIIQDGAVDKSKIRVIAGDEAKAIIRREARTGARGLPGRGGG